MFKFGKITRKRLLLPNNKSFHWGKEDTDKEKSYEQKDPGFGQRHLVKYKALKTYPLW